MCNAQHNGDARAEQFGLPLHLNAQIELGDAVLSSPVIVGGRIYVVDQMGAAYGIGLKTGVIAWKTAPEGSNTFGSNTSSPCVAKGRVFYGTVAGNLHILNAGNGTVIKSIKYDWPIMDAITYANDSVYFQTLNGVVHCLDLDGHTRWVWDQYRLTRESEITNGQNPRTDGRSSAYFSSSVVSVSGNRVVTAIADDLICLKDLKTRAQFIWKKTEPLGKVYCMSGAAISGEYVYVPCPGKDGKGGVIRLKLLDGTSVKREDSLTDQWASMESAAVRGETMFFGRQTFGVTAYHFGKGRIQWSTFSDKSSSLIPVLSAPALSADYCFFTTTHGELIAVSLSSQNRGLDAAGAKSFRFKSPHGKAITSSPAISNGKVCFGCDDGFLYVLSSDTAIEPVRSKRTLHTRKSRTTVKGQRAYDWPSAYGGPANTNFIQDSRLKPPFRLRYAVRSGGLFKHPVCATKDDIYYVTLGGLVVCREQETGRMRWRRKLPGQVWTRSTLLCAEGKVFISRMFSLRYPMAKDLPSTFFCLDDETGEILWEKPIGIGDRLRASPVYAAGVVAYGSLYKDGETDVQKVNAWDADSGESLWTIQLNSSGKMLNGPSGCAGDGTMFFTGGGETDPREGETIALAPRTGKILWRTNKAYASQTGTPSYRDGRIYLPGAYKLPISCLSAQKGEIMWQQDSIVDRWHVETCALGPDYFTVNNKYEGGAWRWNLASLALEPGRWVHRRFVG
jgi:outer membrane protein assembly factor BamB